MDSKVETNRASGERIRLDSKSSIPSQDSGNGSQESEISRKYSRTAMANDNGLRMHLEFPTAMQNDCLDMAFQYINDLHEDTVNERIPNTLYTEENIKTLQDIFALAIKEKYVSAVKDKIKFLQAHWYEKVRQMEVAEPERRNVAGKNTQLTNTKRSWGTYMEVKEEPHFACPCCTKAYRRKSACRIHIKKVNPYSTPE